MRALVTGGNRYTGLDLVFELARRAHEITVDRMSFIQTAGFRVKDVTALHGLIARSSESPDLPRRP
jgi:NAD(P)-dependent dehydrogenase (short-subunit alcohol dehydrogenase family)